MEGELALPYKMAWSLLAEVLWLGVGAGAGFLGVLGGLELAEWRRPELRYYDAGYFLVWIFVPPCGVLSAAAAAACQFSLGVSEIQKRILICGGLNVLLMLGVIGLSQTLMPPKSKSRVQ